MLSLATPAIRTTRRFVSLFAAFGAFTVGLIAQGNLVSYYQPVDFPQWDGIANNVTASNPKGYSLHPNTEPNLVCGWIRNDGPSGKTTGLQRTGELRIGKIDPLGTYRSYDYYLSFLKFNIEGLPQDVVQVRLILTGAPNQDPNKRVNFYVYPNMSAWDPNTITFANRPAYGNGIGLFQTPNPSGQVAIDITEFYRNWKNGTWTNYGVCLHNQSTTNYWGRFVSSRVPNDTASNAVSYTRPMLEITFKPTLRLQMPVPKAYQWKVTTPIGALDPMDAESDADYKAHQADKYYAIDIGHTHKTPASLVDQYPEGVSVPILAAATGVVVRNLDKNDIVPETNKPNLNGNLIVLKHTVPGIPGYFTTWYAHMAVKSPLNIGDSVNPGSPIGVMGNTGVGGQLHLHFAIKYHPTMETPVYPGTSYAGTAYLSNVSLEDDLLKVYQPEAIVDSNSVYKDGKTQAKDYSNRSYYWSLHVISNP
jgi:hypothetical protein